MLHSLHEPLTVTVTFLNAWLPFASTQKWVRWHGALLLGLWLARCAAEEASSEVIRCTSSVLSLACMLGWLSCTFPTLRRPLIFLLVSRSAILLDHIASQYSASTGPRAFRSLLGAGWAIWVAAMKLTATCTAAIAIVLSCMLLGRFRASAGACTVAASVTLLGTAVQLLNTEQFGAGVRLFDEWVGAGVAIYLPAVILSHASTLLAGNYKAAAESLSAAGSYEDFVALMAQFGITEPQAAKDNVLANGPGFKAAPKALPGSYAPVEAGNREAPARSVTFTRTVESASPTIATYNPTDATAMSRDSDVSLTADPAAAGLSRNAPHVLEGLTISEGPSCGGFEARVETETFDDLDIDVSLHRDAVENQTSSDEPQAMGCSICGISSTPDPARPRALENMKLQRALLDHWTDIASHWAHELKNPMGAAHALAETTLEMASSGANDETSAMLITTNVKAIISSTALAIAMINHTRDRLKMFAATEASAFMTFSKVEVTTLVDKVASSMLAGLEASRVKLNQSMPNQPCWIVTDQERLAGAIRMLVTIFSRHAARKPISLTVVATHDSVTIKVMDSGKGFSDAELERFGLPYDEMDRAQPGSAMSVGLTAIKRFTELSEGAFTIYNDTPNSPKKCGATELRFHLVAPPDA